MDEGWEPIEVRTDGPDAGDDRRRRDAPARLRHLAVATEPIIGPGLDADDEVDVTLPRLARHPITLADGHEVGVAVCGRGVPLVVVHGFSAEGILYAQTLSRLVDLGFKVIAIDTAGHGGTLGLPTGAQSMASYAELLGRVLDHLGVREAVFVGHSMGGRLVTELAANDPHRAIAVVLLDAIVGDTWDRMVNVSRVFPPLLAGVGVTLRGRHPHHGARGSANPRQAAKLGSLVGPTIRGHVRRPWRLLGPAASILRSGGTKWMLEELRRAKVPVFVIHGDRDFAVPLSTAKAAARRARGDLVVVARRLPLLAPQGPRDPAGDHARPDAGPARHRGPEGQAGPASTSTPPTTRSRPPSTPRAPWCRELTPQAAPPRHRGPPPPPAVPLAPPAGPRPRD